MDMTIATAAYNGLKFAKDSLTTLVQGKVEKQPERIRRYFQHDPVKYAA